MCLYIATLHHCPNYKPKKSHLIKYRPNMDLLRSSWVMQIYSLQVKPMKDFFISLEIDSSLISLARPGP